MKDNAIIYYGEQRNKDCEKIKENLHNFGYQVSIQPFGCDWDYYYPAKAYFDYAIRYHNKIFGSLRAKTGEFHLKVIEFAKIYFDYIICSSEILKEVWIKNGIKPEYLLSPNRKFKFQIAGDW